MVFLMHELVEISNKVCTMNNTQLYKGKKRVFTSHEQVFLLHELDLKIMVFLMHVLVKISNKLVP